MAFWPLTNSNFPTDRTFCQFHDLDTELDLHRIMSGFHGAFATACQQGKLTPPDTWFRPLFEGLHMLWLLRIVVADLHQFYDIDTDLDLYRITSGFHGVFATVVACYQGALTLPDTRFCPLFGGLTCAPIVYKDFSNLPCLYSTFYLEYPSVLSRFCS